MNRQAKALIVVVAVVLALVGIRVGLSMMHRPDDQKLIHEALQESIKASREGRPGGVMDKISESLKINQADPGSRSQIANFIKNSRPNVTVYNDKAVVTGDQATIVTPVDVELPVFGKRHLSEVTLIFRKEDATEYLFLPTRKWRLAEITAPDTAAQEFMLQ